MDADLRSLRRSAERRARELAARARRAPPLRGPARFLRVLEHLRQGVVRKGKMLVREHWDLAAFDVVFGCIKAFGVYPALYFAGLVWTIPLMEALFLNTQLWTGGYLVVRGRLRSELGRRRYGHPLTRLDALGDRLLGIAPRDARHLHRFRLGGQDRLIRVRHGRLRAAWARWRGTPEEGVVLQATLRRQVAPELRFLANPLRANPYLYEAVLLATLLEDPSTHPRLLAASAPDPAPGEEEGALSAVLGEAPVAALARVNEQADALAAELRARLPRAASARCLRSIHRAFLRAVRARLAELEEQRYRLLADRVEGRPLRGSPHWGALCRKRAEVRAWVERAGRLAERASRVRGEAEARELVRRALAEAQARGLPARRARATAWLAGIAPLPAPWLAPARGLEA